jgi:hypothetical protein
MSMMKASILGCSASLSHNPPNMAVERDGHELHLWFPTLRSGRPSLLRYSVKQQKI